MEFSESNAHLGVIHTYSQDSHIRPGLICESLAQPTYFEGKWAGTGWQNSDL